MSGPAWHLRPRHWILDPASRTTRPAADYREWADTFPVAADARRVGGALLRDLAGEAVEVSTVFCGHDLGTGSGPPELFETMVFGGTLDGEQWRYTTWNQALAGHQAVCWLVLNTPRQRALPAPPLPPQPGALAG